MLWMWSATDNICNESEYYDVDDELSSNELDMNDESSELEINDPDGDNESSNELGMNNQQAQISSTIGDINVHARPVGQ